MRKLLIGLLVLLALVVVVDRVALAVAESQAATRLQRSENLSSKPSVSITGFPFLTQLIRRQFRHVDIRADGLVIQHGGKSVRVSSLTAELDRVTASRDLSSAKAESGSGRALINYADLSKVLGYPVNYDGIGQSGHGRVRATRSITILGQDLSGSVSAEPTVTAPNTISFASPQVSAAGVTLPQPITDTLISIFSDPLHLDGLPAGLTVRQVIAAPAGLIITLDARNISFG
jgi:hypothetical protein